jgi:hypothetical protein
MCVLPKADPRSTARPIFKQETAESALESILETASTGNPNTTNGWKTFPGGKNGIDRSKTLMRGNALTLRAVR